MDPSVVEAEGLGKRYRVGAALGGSLREAISARLSGRDRRGEDFWALRDVNVVVRRGESVGVIGRNGAGKSTFLRLLSQITEPTEGFCRTRGRVGVLLEVGTGFHPELTGRENVFLNGAVLGMTRRDILARFDRIAEFAGVDAFLDTPLKRYSTGMQLRLAFAVAAHLEPEILVVDEVLAVGDAEFQARCLGRMSELTGEGRTVIFVSHDLGAVARLCPRALWLDAGRVRLDAGAGDAIGAYTEGLAAAGTGFAAERDLALDAQILSASLGGSGQATVPRGQPLEFELLLATTEAGADADVSIWIVNEDGVRLVDDCWSDDGDRPAGRLPAGTHSIGITIPGILSPGSYRVGFWLGSAYQEWEDREFLTIRVAPHPADTDLMLRRRRAAVPPVSWRMDDPSR